MGYCARSEKKRADFLARNIDEEIHHNRHLYPDCGVHRRTLISGNMTGLSITNGRLSGLFGNGLPARQTGEQFEQMHTEIENSEAIVTTTTDINVKQTTMIQIVANLESRYDTDEIHDGGGSFADDFSSPNSSIETIQSWWIRYRRLN